MRIACVDKTAADRLSLKRIIESSYGDCRNAVGHLSSIEILPLAKDELIVNSTLDAVIIGCGYSIDEAYLNIKELLTTRPGLPCMVLVAEKNYSLRNLRRFEKLNVQPLLENDHIRIIHTLILFEQQLLAKRHGKVVTIQGVKGGVGSTSIAAGITHAAQALGKKALIIDLSQQNVLPTYFSCERWQSAEYAALLKNNQLPDATIAERCIIEAPNSINLLLQPAGGSEIRELWLRDDSRLELSLTLVDILRDIYDIIIIDIAQSEGVLSYALQCIAHARLLITANEPASVHLLNAALNNLHNLPGDGSSHILINMLHDRSLSHEDVLDFLHYNKTFSKSMALLEPIPYNLKSGGWIGTGNTFYTEGPKDIQYLLEDTLNTCLLDAKQIEERAERQFNFFSGLKRLVAKKTARRKFLPTIKGLPLLHQADSRNFENKDYSAEALTLRPQNNPDKFRSVENLETKIITYPLQKTNRPKSDELASKKDVSLAYSSNTVAESEELFEPPRLKV